MSSKGLNTTILKEIIDLNKNVVVENVEYCSKEVQAFGELQQQDFLVLGVRPFERDRCRCPVCGKKCVKDGFKQEKPSVWRAPNMCHVPVLITYRPQRILCPEHGALNESLPWADGTSRFTKEFNNDVAWMVRQATKTAVCTYFGINWRTVGNCLQAVQNRLEPDIVESRIHCGLRRICVDETSYKDGQKYITVVYDMDRNRVVWVHDNHGYEVFAEFCRLLTPEEQKQIEIVAGDGAKWITKCRDEFFPNAVRCMDPFHVTQWVNNALDEVRRELYQRARRDLAEMKKLYEGENQVTKEAYIAYLEYVNAQQELSKIEMLGGTKKHLKEVKNIIETYEQKRRDEDIAKGIAPQEFVNGDFYNPPQAVLTKDQEQHIEHLKEMLKFVKGSRYALCHNPENCTDAQNDKLNVIANSYPELYKAYQLKETLRQILHMKDWKMAESCLEEWQKDAKESGIGPMVELTEKIKRNAGFIINSVKYQANSAKSEATNTTIKALIRLARGFRNHNNLMALVYLKCSDIVIKVKHMLQPSNEYLENQRKKANEDRLRREGAKANIFRVFRSARTEDPEDGIQGDFFGPASADC